MARAAAAPAAWPCNDGKDLLRRRPARRRRGELARRLRPRGEPWTALPNMPTARDHFHAAVLDGKLWAIGGRNVQIGSTTTVNEAFDFATNSWSTEPRAAPHPARRLRGRGTQGDEVFVIGGEDATKAHGTVEAYNVEDQPVARWRRRCRCRATASRRPSATAASTSPQAGRRPGHNPSTGPPRVLPRRCRHGRAAAWWRSARARSAARARAAPTSLQFGPDGRLYVAQQNGLIKALHGRRDRRRTTTRSPRPRRSPRSSRSPTTTTTARSTRRVNDRLVTGILVAGTAANPVIYVASSDPRIGGGAERARPEPRHELGRSSRELTWNGSALEKLDLVRGLPRSEENHAANGMALDPATNTLYVAQGGNTNKGAPSNNFALPARVRAVGRHPLDRPRRDRQHDLRPAHARRRRPAGHARRQRPVRRQRRQEPGEARRPAGRCRSTRPASATRTTSSSPRPAACTRSTTAPTPAGATCRVGDGHAGTCTNGTPTSPAPSDRDTLHLHHRPGLLRRPPEPDARQHGQHVQRAQPAVAGPAANPVECDYRSSRHRAANDGSAGHVPATRPTASPSTPPPTSAAR